MFSWAVYNEKKTDYIRQHIWNKHLVIISKITDKILGFDISDISEISSYKDEKLGKIKVAHNASRCLAPLLLHLWVPYTIA